VTLAVLVLVIGAVVVKRGISSAGAEVPSEAAEGGRSADWFLLVRCPEMPMEAGGAEDGRRQMRAWIHALREAGFHTHAFADAIQKLERGEHLPENTVVLMFDPAYRSTVEQLLPTLETERAPALWVTRSPGRVRADRRFVTGHARRSLSEEALWDFAVENESGQVILEKASAGTSAGRTHHWQADRGITGVNAGTNMVCLQRLHASAQWSARQFVDRLLADVPLRERRPLSARRIQERIWGVVLPHGQEETFDLVAPAGQRFASAIWEGTRGVTDLGLDLSIDSWFGEFWLTLRSDPERGEKVRIGLAEERVRVLQEAGGRVIDDRELPWRVDPEAGARFRVMLLGPTLTIDTPMVGAPMVVPVLISGNKDSRLELALYHRIHGVAMARGVQLQAVPLESRNAVPIPDAEFAATGSAAKTALMGGSH